MNNYALVYIEWEDSYGGGGRWQSINDLEPVPCIQRSIGWEVFNKNGYTVIVPHLSSDEEHTSVEFTGQGEMTIPNSAIRFRKEIPILSLS